MALVIRALVVGGLLGVAAFACLAGMLLTGCPIVEWVIEHDTHHYL